MLSPRWRPRRWYAFHAAAWSTFLVLPWLAKGIVPQNKPVTIKQNGWCFDHQWNSDPDRLILYLCSGGKNQQFVWRKEEDWDFAHLVSVLDDKCVGLEETELDSSGEPKEEALVTFRDCKDGDTLLKWKYEYGEGQLQLASFPGHCLDFSDNHNFFIVYHCKEDRGHDDDGNQKATFVDDVKSPIQAGVPVEIQHMKGSIFNMWSGSCLDQSVEEKTKDQLTLYHCKGTANQLFTWTGSGQASRRHLEHLVSSIDGRCVYASDHTIGAPLVLRPCGGGGPEPLSRWRYAHGLQQIKLVKWPYLCMGTVSDETHQVGVVGCALSPEPHFEVVDVGRTRIQERIPLEIKQGGWCLDRNYDAKPNKLRLSRCKGGTDQEFVWRGSDEKGFHFLSSSFDDQCLGIEKHDADDDGEPKEWAPIAFKECDATDDLVKWDFAYGPDQLRMKMWPERCMQFDEHERVFAVAKCLVADKDMLGKQSTVQSFEFAKASKSKRIPTGVPTNIRVGYPWKSRCLERPPGEDSLATSSCDEALTIDQQFEWLTHKSWDFSLLRSLVDDKCASAPRVEAGAVLELKSCNDSDKSSRWIYSHSRGFLKLAESPHLCMELSGDKGQMALAKCRYSHTVRLARTDEELEFRETGLKRIAEDIPLTIQHEDHCLDQHFDEAYLRLYRCHRRSNQQFVWTGDPEWNYHHLISHIDNRCVGVSDSDTDADGRPYRKSPIVFKDCVDRDPLIRWVYSYGRRQLQLADWPFLCVEFDSKLRYFVIAGCAVPDDTADGKWLDPNQDVLFDGVLADTTRRRRSRRRRHVGLDGDDEEEAEVEEKWAEASNAREVADFALAVGASGRASPARRAHAPVLGVLACLALTAGVMLVRQLRWRVSRSPEVDDSEAPLTVEGLE